MIEYPIGTEARKALLEHSKLHFESVGPVFASDFIPVVVTDITGSATFNDLADRRIDNLRFVVRLLRTLQSAATTSASAALVERAIESVEVAQRYLTHAKQ